MELSDETLQQIREMAAALLPPAEIAILISLPAGERSYFCDICKIIIILLSTKHTIRDACKQNSNSEKL
ncbi:hypothetical protein ACIXOF_06480 [Bacteroides fragilis]|nr:hypothetical protein [Bacteroides fragilis]